MEKFLNTKHIIFLLVTITVIGFILRMYRIDGPIADWHSWRQADTASVSRNFIQDGFTPLFPKYDTLNPLNETGEPNPNRYFFAEFPLYNILTYPIYLKFGINEIYPRLISIFFSSLTVVVLYFLVSQYSSKRVALISSALYAVLPYNIYYGRVILPDPMHIFFSVLLLYLVSLWLQKNNMWIALLAGMAGAIAILTKPYALVLFLPILVLMYEKWNVKLVTKWTIYAFGIVMMVPFLLWRSHISQYPEGMFGTTWLFNQGNIRFTGAYFRWLIFDRMNRLIFATGGFALFWIGIISAFTKREAYFYFSWLLSIIVFFVVIAKGNVTHDYYQMPLVPIGVIMIAKGLEFLITRGKTIIRKIFYNGLALTLILMMLAFGWFEVRDYFNINHPEIVEAGRVVDRTLPKDAIVIAPYDNDPAFLYQTNRLGFTFGGDKIQQYIDQGAQYLVSTNFDDSTNEWMKKCTVLTKTDTYVIVDLKNCPNL